MTHLVSTRRRDPLADWLNAPFRTVFPDFSDVLRDALPTTLSARNGAAWSPSAEVLRDGDDALVRLEVPGLKPEDIKVEVTDGRLVVSGERRDDHAAENNGRTVREIRYGAFRRSFALPAHISEDAISASYDAGVLTVKVAGIHAGSSPVRIPVEGAAPAAVEAAAQPADDTPADSGESKA